MSNIDLRYVIREGAGFGSGFIVYDQKESREICGCALRKDAEMVVGALNKAWGMIQDEEKAIELGG